MAHSKTLLNKAITATYLTFTGVLVLAGSSAALAAAGDTSLGGVSQTVISSLGPLVQLITGASYVVGMGFALAGLVKFKAHKDNPQQVPLSAPIVLVIIAAALLFLPSILKTAGGTLFGEERKAGSAEGFSTFDQ